MKKPYDEGYFFEIQSLEEMHALNALRVLANLEMFLDIGNARVPKKPH